MAAGAATGTQDDVAVPALIGGDASFGATLKAYLAGAMPSAALASLWDTLQVCRC